MPVEQSLMGGSLQRGHISFVSPLDYFQRPYHPDARGRVPELVSNGAKGRFAREAGLHVVSTPSLLQQTATAENAYHAAHKETAIGPFWIQDKTGAIVPYPIAVAREKKRAIEAKQGDAAYFCTDSVYRVRIPGKGVDETYHKPADESDLQMVLIRLYELTASGNAEFMSTTGIVRGDGEEFLVVTRLGTLSLNDPGELEQRLRENGTASLGTPTLKIDGVLVQLPQVIHTAVYRAPEDGGTWRTIKGVLQPIEQAHIEFPSDQPLTLHRAGLGFFGVPGE